ncbi:MAG: rhomboid family intramembrane serine protease [Chloroflexi bacterium]|nr:rhomboid family intramembrane serine protease [Chloroflexota bacterium]
MLPLSDINPTRRFPVLNYTLIIINILVFLWELRLPPSALEAALTNLSVVPANVSNNLYSLETFLDIMRSMFFHAGWAHLLGNMLYLYLFGDNVEDRLGRALYLILYFGSGFAAAFAQVAIDPTSPIVLVGASGARRRLTGGHGRRRCGLFCPYRRLCVRDDLDLDYYDFCASTVHTPTTADAV